MNRPNKWPINTGCSFLKPVLTMVKIYIKLFLLLQKKLNPECSILITPQKQQPMEAVASTFKKIPKTKKTERETAVERQFIINFDKLVQFIKFI